MKKITFLVAALCTAMFANATEYEKVLDATTLQAGDVVVFGSAANNAVNGLLGENKFLAEVDATFSEDGVATAEGAGEITLSGDADGWTLTTSEGKLNTTKAKAMNTDEKACTWTIVIDEDGKAVITSSTEGHGKILYNVSNPRFLNYTSEPQANMLLPELYKKRSGSTAIENVEASDIYAANGRIEGIGAGRIYTVSGMDVTEQNGQLRGIYVVKVDGKAHKIAVK